VCETRTDRTSIIVAKASLCQRIVRFSDWLESDRTNYLRRRLQTRRMVILWFRKRSSFWKPTPMDVAQYDSLIYSKNNKLYNTLIYISKRYFCFIYYYDNKYVRCLTYSLLIIIQAVKVVKAVKASLWNYPCSPLDDLEYFYSCYLYYVWTELSIILWRKNELRESVSV